MRPRLSAIVITYNEAHQIARCLEKLHFADEIVVFDSGSTDDTVSICRQYTSHVTVTDWPGDGPQKNRAFEAATGDWLLCVDADELVSEALALEIQQAIENTSHAAFSVPFQSYYLGRAIRYGDWRGEAHVRLIRRGYGTFTPAYVYGADGAHCELTVKGTTGALKNKIAHYPFPSVERMLEKLNAYSSGSAAIRHHKGKRGGVLVAIAHALWSFFRGYIIRRGFLDGREGFILAISNAEGTYYRYIKLWYLAQQASEAKP